MKIVSLNAWGGQVWDTLAPWVSGLDADVLCLQEVIRAPVPSPEWLHYEDPYRKLAQRADLFGDISGLMPMHQGTFAPAARGTLRDGSGADIASEHGIAVWVRRNLAITHVTQDFIHGTFRRNGWGPEPVPRTMQAMRIEDPDTGQALCVAHLHGLRDPAGKGDTPDRAAQAGRILSILETVWKPGTPCVLAGDFNVLPDSETLALLRAAGLIDLISLHGITDTRTDLYTKAQRFADYMLVTPDLCNARFEVPATPAVSDHRALILSTQDQ